MTEKRILVINIPVIHKGFLNFIKKNQNKISHIYIVENKLVEKVLGTKEDIASFDHNIAQKLFRTFGFQKVQTLNEKNIEKIKNEKLLLVNDKFSREIVKLYFIEKNIKWASVFLPSDYTPYQVGHIRDFVKAGERQELSSTIHSEQKIIAEAARKGISLEGTSLYITHFPCPVCVKIIIFSGIKCCYFSQGTANLSGEKLLKLFGIKLLAVDIKNKKK